MDQLTTLAMQVGAALQSRGWRLVTAESCTGGWVAKQVTDIAGSSEWFDRGLVTYSNAAKCELLGVRATTLATHGAVSAETAREMVEGAVMHSTAQVAVAVTGIAGPGGATPGKPVGTVWFAWLRRGGDSRVRGACFDGDREAVRRQAVAAALGGLLDLLHDSG